MTRLDVYLKKMNAFESRMQAQDAIKEGLIKVNGEIVKKASFHVNQEDKIICESYENHFASRAGNKLYHAFNSFNVDIKDNVVLDIGASTGGFSDVCLQYGAQYIYAVDSGSDQLLPRLKEDKRICCMENINARYLEKKMFTKKIDFVCMDVSFISIKLICDNLFQLLEKPYHCVFLIKPQFEAGKSFVGKNGIVKDRKVHKRILDDFITYFNEKGLFVLHLEKSAIIGRDGNQEYLIHLSSEGKNNKIDTLKLVKERNE